MKKPTNVLAKLTSFIQAFITKLKTRLGSNPNQKLLALGFIAFFAIIGTYFLLATKAAGPFASIDLGSTSVTSPVTNITDQTASGGSAVQFGGGSTTTPPPSSSGDGCVGTPNKPGGADPWGTCWPGPHNTGYPRGLPGDTRAPVVLTTYTGPREIYTDNTVIENKHITSGLYIRASNVTIKRSLITGGVDLGYAEAQNVLMEDVEINAGNTTYAAVGSANFTCRRCNIYGGGQGINAYSFTLEDSWIHDMYGTGAVHSETILGYNGNIKVIHNYLSGNYNEASGNFDANDGGMSSSVSFYEHWGPANNVEFKKNWLNVGGGDRDYAGYCLYAGGNQMSNGIFTDNIFALHPSNPTRCGYYGSVVNKPTGAGSFWSNNRHEDGSLIP
jgi:hypothetical protein